MGSFSWNRADTLGEYENICEGQAYKLLIPKEFGGGFIQDSYRGYGKILDTRTNKQYDIYELFAFWNKDEVEPISEIISHPMIIEKGSVVTIEIKPEERHMFIDEAIKLEGHEFTIVDILGMPKTVFRDDYNPYKRSRHATVYELSGEAGKLGYWTLNCFKNTAWYEKLTPEGLKYINGNWEPLPEKSKYTSHNRSIGINIFDRSEGNNGTVKYPLKLVSVEFEGTYEDCNGYSKDDPDQGFFPRKRNKYFYN